MISKIIYVFSNKIQDAPLWFADAPKPNISNNDEHLKNDGRENKILLIPPTTPELGQKNGHCYLCNVHIIKILHVTYVDFGMEIGVV